MCNVSIDKYRYTFKDKFSEQILDLCMVKFIDRKGKYLVLGEATITVPFLRHLEVGC